MAHRLASVKHGSGKLHKAATRVAVRPRDGAPLTRRLAVKYVPLNAETATPAGLNLEPLRKPGPAKGNLALWTSFWTRVQRETTKNNYRL